MGRSDSNSTFWQVTTSTLTSYCNTSENSTSHIFKPVQRSQTKLSDGLLLSNINIPIKTKDPFTSTLNMLVKKTGSIPPLTSKLSCSTFMDLMREAEPPVGGSMFYHLIVKYSLYFVCSGSYWVLMKWNVWELVVTTKLHTHLHIWNILKIEMTF